MRVLSRLGLAASVILLGTTCFPTSAFAEPQGATTAESVPTPERRSLARRMTRLHGMVEAGLGWLTLPGAEVCVERGANPDCRRGDASLALEAWQIFRLPSAFAVGGGVMLGLTPTTDAPAKEFEDHEELDDVERDHTRGYLTIEATTRYYPYVGNSFEGWLGLTGGLVVISDEFSTVQASNEAKPLVGPSGVVVRTEGAAFGIAGGVAYEFARNWTVGGSLRLGSWFLPQTPDTSPLGDEASLVGQNSMFVVSLNLAYRVQL